MTKLDVDAATVATWDRGLPRDSRLLVPIDVQLFVPEAGDEAMVRLPSALNAADGQGPGFPPPFTAGTKRPAGVHVQWAPPDALMRGQLDVTPDRNRLGLAPLPDRWIVLRLLTPVGATTAAVHGWVLEADRAVRAELVDWPAGSTAATPAGATVAPAELTGAAGGVPTWAVTYDSVENRFALHDPLDDLARRSPPTASPATPPPTWWRAGGPTRRSTRSTPPTTPTASTSCCTHSVERGHPVGRHARLPAYRTTSRSAASP